MVHIRILQLDLSLPDDSPIMDNKHTGSLGGLDEYGIFGKSVTDHSSGDDICKEGAKRPKLNTEIQGKAMRSS